MVTIHSKNFSIYNKGEQQMRLYGKRLLDYAIRLWEDEGYTIATVCSTTNINNSYVVKNNQGSTRSITEDDIMRIGLFTADQWWADKIDRYWEKVDPPCRCNTPVCTCNT